MDGFNDIFKMTKILGVLTQIYIHLFTTLSIKIITMCNVLHVHIVYPS